MLISSTSTVGAILKSCCASEELPAPEPISKSLDPTADAPRLLFSVRLRETFQPGDSMVELFTEWIRGFPAIADQMSVEATFDSHSAIIILSLPISVAAYLPRDPSITCLGPIISPNRMARSATSYNFETERVQKLDSEDLSMQSLRLQGNQTSEPINESTIENQAEVAAGKLLADPLVPSMLTLGRLPEFQVTQPSR